MECDHLALHPGTRVYLELGASLDAVPTTNWNGVSVRVSARVVPRYAWLTTSIDVAVDDRTVLRTGGVLKVVGVRSEAVNLAGAQRQMELSWGRFTGGSFPFSLAIDGAVVLESRVAAPYWWLAFWPYAALAALLGIALARVTS